MSKFKNMQLAETLLLNLGSVLHMELRHVQLEAREGPLSHRMFAKLSTLAGHINQYARASRDLAAADHISQFSDQDLEAALELTQGVLRKQGLFGLTKPEDLT